MAREAWKLTLCRWPAAAIPITTMDPGGVMQYAPPMGKVSPTSAAFVRKAGWRIVVHWGWGGGSLVEKVCCNARCYVAVVGRVGGLEDVGKGGEV